jgi:SAM-dependent methyltransferase
VITVDFKRLPIRPGYRILDLGCGSGRHTGAAYRQKAVIAIGVDLSFENVVETDKRLKYHDELGEHGDGAWGTCVADIIRLPFRDNVFDLVLCSEVLEHISGHRTAAREINRVLKPGGDLVVSVPRYYPEKICWHLSAEYRRSEGGHLRIYKKKALIDLLSEAEAETWCMHFAHSLHTPYWWLKCLVGPTRVDSFAVNLYHRFLIWDIMKQPKVTRFFDNLLNPMLGKSLVLYLRKKKGS